MWVSLSSFSLFSLSAAQLANELMKASSAKAFSAHGNYARLVA